MIDLMYIQRLFKFYGNLYTGTIDGLHGPQTGQATVAFQKARGLIADGIIGDGTTEEVKAITRRVQYIVGVEQDGLFGPATQAAVEKKYGTLFQSKEQAYKILNDNQPTGKASANFDYAEFYSEDGKKMEHIQIAPALISLLQNIRNVFGVPITITSGYRTRAYNNSLPNSKKESEDGIDSAHVFGRAADIYVPGVAPADVKRVAYSYGAHYSYYGTSEMGAAVHVDV